MFHLAKNVSARLFLAFLVLLALLPSAASAQTTIRIGVLAKRGEPVTTARWDGTAQYLEERIPDARVSIVPLSFDAITDAVARGSVDFVLTNSAQYVLFEVRYGAARIVTMKNAEAVERGVALRSEGVNGASLTTFGSAIFARSDRAELIDTPLPQLIRSAVRGTGEIGIAAVDPTSLGGWLMAYGELLSAGIPLAPDSSALSFLGTHDAVVNAVRDGQADIGIVRSDTLERMAAEGRIDLSQFALLPVPGVSVDPTFPFMSSTRLYPEWPFAVLPHVDARIAELVAAALLAMPSDHPAAREALVAGWSIAANYEPVHKLLRQTQSAPYETYGVVTPAQILAQYGVWIGALTVAIFVALAAVVTVVVRNHQLHRLRASLQDQVDEQTRELRTANAQLVRAIEEKDVLLAEVHHRVKNNLQVIVSLMNLQLDSIRDPDDVSAMRRLQTRITSMSLVHESFEALTNAAAISVGAYLESLAVQTMTGLGLSSEHDVVITFDVDDTRLDLGRSVPFGLIVCELLTNALQHGRQPGMAASVSMLLAHDGTHVDLRVIDDGPGVHSDPEQCSECHLGLMLVSILTEQLNGTFELVRQPAASGAADAGGVTATGGETGPAEPAEATAGVTATGGEPPRRAPRATTVAHLRFPSS